MDPGTSEYAQGICWFCRRGRHGECMGEIPTEARSDGPHDCTFDTQMVPCRCGHEASNTGGTA